MGQVGNSRLFLVNIKAGARNRVKCIDDSGNAVYGFDSELLKCELDCITRVVICRRVNLCLTFELKESCAWVEERDGGRSAYQRRSIGVSGHWVVRELSKHLVGCLRSDQHWIFRVDAN